MNIFEYDDYKAFVGKMIEINQDVRGYKTKLAEAAHCQKTYLSQVLNSHVHLTPEHAMGLAIFWNFNATETEYWLELVHLGRTSFPPLIQKIKGRLSAIQKDRADFAKRFKAASLQSLENQTQYYSSWVYGVIHMLVSLPPYQNPNSLARKLDIPISKVIDVLNNLEKMKLVEKRKNGWIAIDENIHLPRDSAMNSMNHQNWRQLAILDITKGASSSLHYSSVQTIDEKTFNEIKVLIMEMIDRQRKMIETSIEEEVACFVCDWFKI